MNPNEHQFHSSFLPTSIEIAAGREVRGRSREDGEAGRSLRDEAVEGQILLQLQSHISLQLLDTHNTFQH